MTETREGWGFTERPAVVVGNAVGRGLIGGSGAKATVVSAIEDGSFIPSVRAKDGSYAEVTRITVEEAGQIQSFPPFTTERSTMKDHSKHTVVDLFAGVGVGVACQNLGVKELGVEWMPEANALREANGMTTIYENVWDAHILERMVEEGLEFDTLWASPPCQSYSTAGNGAGRKALDDVLAVIHDKAYLDMTELRERSEALGDERIGLVLSPLHYAMRFKPAFIAFEQVPPVLPVWEAMAVELREAGYSVWTGYLQAEMYGVPQTRKRAFLMARNDGKEVKPPVPTHSRYYSRTPEKLDPGVKKWVSMAEALAWDVERPAPTVTGGGTATGVQNLSGDAAETRSGGLVVRSNYGTGGDASKRGERHDYQPSATVTEKIGRNLVLEDSSQ